MTTEDTCFREKINGKEVLFVKVPKFESTEGIAKIIAQRHEYDVSSISRVENIKGLFYSFMPINRKRLAEDGK